MCVIKGDTATGDNHYTSDHCLWNGVFVTMLSHKYKLQPTNENYNNLKFYAVQYLENWIDNEGFVRRGWVWDKEIKKYEYRISLDQIAGLISIN